MSTRSTCFDWMVLPGVGRSEPRGVAVSVRNVAVPPAAGGEPVRVELLWFTLTGPRRIRSVRRSGPIPRLPEPHYSSAKKNTPVGEPADELSLDKTCAGRNELGT
jgi:hypothetical protein